MATSEDVFQVRVNTNELGREDYSDDILGGIIDSLGSVEAASAEVWDRKAAKFSELVNVSEAGASRSLSDLYKNALSMSDRWRARIPGAEEDATDARRAKVFKIERS